MIISRTKYNATEAEIRSLFGIHGIGNVIDCVTLGDGEFNATYKVTIEGGKDYVLKIAPPKEVSVLSYEKNMMDSEVYWYSKMKEQTDILCPDLYAIDFSCKVIKSSCFIMQMMDGKILWKCDFSESERERVQSEKIGMLAKIHGVKNDKYGYRQLGLYSSWYEALRSMAGNLVKDCKDIGYETPDGV